MNDSATYYREHEAEDAMSVLARWMGQNHNVRVVYHDGTAVDADIFKGIIRIPRMACASGITQEALMLLRTRVYHEAGHIDETKLAKSDYPKGALFEIWNALEDRRMEAVESGRHKGCEIVFRWGTNHFNRKIAAQMAEGKTDAPLWEALVAMSLMVEGVQPAWHLGPKAQDYVDAAYSEFIKIKQCSDAKSALELAKVIFKLLKDVNDEWKKSEPPKPQPQQGQKNQDQKGQKGQQDQKGQQGEGEGEGQDQQGEGGESEGEGEGQEGEPQSGGSKDFDDYEDESKKPGKGQKGEDDEDGEKTEGDTGDEEEGEGGKSKTDKVGDKKDDADADGSDEGGDKGDGSKDGEGDDKEGSGQGKDGEGDKGEGQDGEGESKGSGEGDKPNDGKDQDGADGSDSEGSGEGSDGEGDEADGESDGAEGGDKGGKGGSEGEGDSKNTEAGDEEGEGTPNGDVKPGDVPYKPEDKEPKGGKGDGKDKRDLEDEFDGLSREKAQNEDLEEFFKNMPAEDKRYTSRRDLDVHSAPQTSDEDKTSYRERLSQVSVTVAEMTRALEQALRSMAKCRKNPYLREGKIDHRRLVAIAKGLSKEVFYRTRDGMRLDVAVAITIDESGSMGNFYEIQLLAMAIGEALNSIGIPFEIIGTTTAYGGGSYQMPPMDGFTRVNPIVYKHYKLFGEQWGNVRDRIVHTGSYHHNVDGEVVEYAAFRLRQRPESRKVVFSLSDGSPCAGHGNDIEMAVNLKNVCKRVRKQGIEVYGFGVGTESPKTYYGAEWFVALDEVEKMGPDFVREFVKIVTMGKVKV